MNLKTELAGLMAAQAPLLHLITYEEERVVRTLLELESARELGVTSWDVADGFVSHRAGQQEFPKKDCTTDTILAHVADRMPRNHVLVLKDFHHCWLAKRGLITRKLRNLAPRLRSQNQFLVFITPPLPSEQDLPRELKDDVMALDVPLPDQKELDILFSEVTATLERSHLPSGAVRDKLLQSALGLTTTQARLAFSRVWAAQRRFDERGIDLITWQKRQVIRESGALEYWPAEEGEAGVGGLDLLKLWLKKREAGFKTEARAAGLPFPRGVALIGIPGTGKSLSAKMLSGLWKLPLLRLDVGALFASLLGESEANLRKAIMLAETVSPCILWIDELEKAFAGSGAGAFNSGAATRVFGTFLTWMQEHKTPVFVVATANEVAALPPELMGRFDRTFFLDLPNDTERRAIFVIHLKNAGVVFPERRFRLEELIERSRGMVGREIERAVREAQFTAFAEQNRELELPDLLAALAETVPLSKSHQEVIETLRKWKTEGRAFPASSEERPAAQRGRSIEV
jgi:MoxR-like ATPase